MSEERVREIVRRHIRRRGCTGYDKSQFTFRKHRDLPPAHSIHSRGTVMPQEAFRRAISTHGRRYVAMSPLRLPSRIRSSWARIRIALAWPARFVKPAPRRSVARGELVEMRSGTAPHKRTPSVNIDRQLGGLRRGLIGRGSGARPWPGYAPLRPDRAAASSPIRRRARGEADG